MKDPWREVLRTRSREKRIELVLVDTYNNEEEELVAFAIYLGDCLEFPFMAVLRIDADDPDAEPFEVVGVSDEDCDLRRGVVCRIRRRGKMKKLPITEIVPLKPSARNRRILEDHAHWLKGFGMGLDEDEA